MYLAFIPSLPITKMTGFFDKGSYSSLIDTEFLLEWFPRSELDTAPYMIQSFCDEQFKKFVRLSTSYTSIISRAPELALAVTADNGAL